MEGTSITTNTMNFDNITGLLVNSSTISTTNIDFDASIGNKIITNELIFSSICMIPSNISSIVAPITVFNSSILICLDDIYWQIPIFPA